MSASISEQSFQYVGILNGVMYRIDPSTGRSIEPMFGLQPSNDWADFTREEPSALVGGALQVAHEAPAVETAADAGVDDAVVLLGRVAAPSNLFPRSGAEPLRAGHPDLWALLVAGTCLEGTPFRHL